MSYYMSKTVNGDYNAILEKTISVLKEEGFGIITEIDVKSTFREKLDVDFRNYKILGACNPQYAFKVLSKDDKVGALLPCNVIVQEIEKDVIEIFSMNPKYMLEIMGNDEIVEVAVVIGDRLQNALNRIV